MDEYLTIDEVAEIFKVTTRTINNWVKNSNMPCFSIKTKGSHRRFLESDVRQWFESFSNQPS